MNEATTKELTSGLLSEATDQKILQRRLEEGGRQARDVDLLLQRIILKISEAQLRHDGGG